MSLRAIRRIARQSQPLRWDFFNRFASRYVSSIGKLVTHPAGSVCRMGRFPAHAARGTLHKQHGQTSCPSTAFPNAPAPRLPPHSAPRRKCEYHQSDPKRKSVEWAGFLPMRFGARHADRMGNRVCPFDKLRAGSERSRMGCPSCHLAVVLSRLRASNR